MNDFIQSSMPGRLLLAACVALLAACVSTPEKEAEAEPVVVTPAEQAEQEAAPEPPPPPKIATPAEQQEAQRVALKVADLLEAGKIEEAHVEIERALEIDPANKLAQNFLMQLTADPVTALGETSFPYTVKSGESLSKISGRYMGDIFQFYILARYNGIAVPRLVAAGQTIRIPGDRPVETKAPKPAPKQVVETPAPKPTEPRTVEPEPVEHKVAQPKVAEPEKVKVEPEVVEVPTKEAPVVEEATPVELAKPVVPTAVEVPAAVELGGTPPVLGTTKADVSPGPLPPPEPTPADRMFQRGLREQAQGNNLAAYQAFREAYAMDPSNREARSNADLMHQEIVADYMRRARAAFAKQDLKGSIKHWDQLLDFDPGNEIAMLERQKAITLQERIKSIQ
ncbi:MAG: LysM peptidoglycan-binding domain-containing protein [Rhodocyclaceae bacterium]|nr:LysM peptidoglycan-binding domain-containing protein [Rhodocyclaceae bacterium]